jgi:hypothetical protein
MLERLGPITVTALRVGRTEVGAASATLDDDALTLVVRVEQEERPLRLRLASIDSVHRSGEELELVLRDGTRVSLIASGDFREALIDRCRTLPELTRTLRAFGSSRARRVASGGRDTDASEQQRFFAPLLEARRAASAAAPSAALAAFDGTALLRSIEDTLTRFAADRVAEAGPARRALEAELVDASEPLFDAMRALAVSASSATESVDDLRLWREWSLQLRRTFETADRVWVAVDEVLDAAHRRTKVTR